MLRIIVAVMIFLASVPSLYADDYAPFRNRFSIFADAGNFYWDEHYNGEKLLDEEGPIYGIGLSYMGFSEQFEDADTYRITYGASLRFYFGQVDYDGQTQAGTPVQTDVDYLGATGEVKLGWMFKTGSNGLFIEPNVFLGVSSWSRDLQSTGTAIGYTENWTNFYTRIGITFAHPFTINSLLSFSGGATIPIYVKNEVDDFGIDLTLEPEAFHLSPYADITYEYKRIGVKLYYESFEFGESDPEYGVFIQPESYTYNFGLRLYVTIF